MSTQLTNNLVFISRLEREKMAFVSIWFHRVIKEPFKYNSGCTFKFFKNLIWKFSVRLWSNVISVTCNINIINYNQNLIKIYLIIQYLKLIIMGSRISKVSRDCNCYLLLLFGFYLLSSYSQVSAVSELYLWSLAMIKSWGMQSKSNAFDRPVSNAA